MKMNLKNIIFILGVLFLGSSCENFLDVHPKGEVTGKELLKDRKGFENALYGVYATMRNQTLYGRYLSYYTLDVMAQYYTSFGNTYVSELRAFNYKQTDVETEFYNIWCKMYNNISNVNNILENLDNISASSLKYYPIYKGEALALRAFLQVGLAHNTQEDLAVKGIEAGDNLHSGCRFMFFHRDLFQHIFLHIRIHVRLRDAVAEQGFIERNTRQDRLGQRFHLACRLVFCVCNQRAEHFVLRAEQSVPPVVSERLDEKRPDLFLLFDFHCDHTSENTIYRHFILQQNRGRFNCFRDRMRRNGTR